jgi:16S rRNA (adenine1518-N6/adenine1519-N6)-dimethyltransferase
VTPGSNVLEVGPGFGALTSRLLAAEAQLTAIEYDHRIASYLREKFAGDPRLKLIEADACKVKLDEVFPENTPYRAIANLPYAISSVFIAGILESRNKPSSMFFMLQKEMGERLAAVPGTKAYGALSVRVQLEYDVRIEKIVPPEVFCPPPEVESALVSFTAHETPLCTAAEAKRTSQIVRCAFNQRRKQMGKVLAHLLGRELTEKVFEECGFSLEVRPDKVSVADFIKLAQGFEKYSAHC